MNRLFAATILFSVFLTSCGGASNDQSENAARAMAETSCLIFDDSVPFEEIPAQSDAIITSYGWEDSLAIDVYLNESNGTEEQNEIAVLLRQYLEEACGEQLKAGGLSAAELAEAIVLE
ncbi:MAG: ABC-type Fe3+-hydroxamate transport system substrate-binding protein [Oceanicoccus sp.]|jgi:ABC-type Fe3+-hydroxamate transport system substrate-binding protein